VRIRYETTIAAPRERVWEILNDFGNVEKFHPLVLNSHSLTELAGGRGAERMCDFGKGVKLFERIIDVDEGRSMDVDIYKREGVPSFVKSMHARFDLESIPDGTLVVGTIEVKIAPKIAELLMGPMMKRQLTKGWRQLLAGLKRHAETSEAIGPDSAIDFKTVTSIAAAG